LKHTPKLQELYPNNEFLFKNILKIRNAGPDLLLQDISECKPTVLADILGLLQDADSLWGGLDDLRTKSMMRLKVFPVRKPSNPNVFVLMNASDTWRIPDERLRMFFCRKIPLLAFTYDAFSDMLNIKSAFDLDSRKLEVKNKVFYEDSNPRQRSLTAGKFQDRIRLMSR
jgi:hypothetical protein